MPLRLPRLNTKTLGRQGEALAAQFLIERGYVILARNWRYGRFEIDIVASIANWLVIVEVKTRSEGGCGEPEESLGYAQEQRLAEAAAAFQEANAPELEMRFDLITVQLSERGRKTIRHTEEAFYP